MPTPPECPICHHTSAHGNLANMITGNLKNNYPKCQVPVRVRLPNNPTIIMGVPCGCDGRGVPTPAPEPDVVAPPPKCVLPGCEEYQVFGSSFCSQEHQDEMVRMVAALTDTPSQEEVHGKHERRDGDG